MEAHNHEEHPSFTQIMDKLSGFGERMENFCGSLKSEISHLSAEIKEEFRDIKTTSSDMGKSSEATWDAVNDLQKDAKTHRDFKRTTQQTLEMHQHEINALSLNLPWREVDIGKPSS